MLLLEFFGLRIFVKLLKVPKHILLPVIVVMCAVGAFAVNSQIASVQAILLFGLVGYAMVKFSFPSRRPSSALSSARWWRPTCGAG